MQIKIRIKCTNPQCENGMVYGPHCKVCGALLRDGYPWWTPGNDTMPCGHSARKYLIGDCPACLGTTWIERWEDLKVLADKLDDRLVGLFKIMQGEKDHGNIC
jgi:hypothetical protein